ncbi:MAG: hypothetical protein ACKO8G_02645 [Actinomycetota bacterium]
MLFLPRARRRGLAVVLSVREGRPTVLVQDRTVVRLHARDLDEPPEVLTRIPLPRGGNARSARFRRDLAGRLLALEVRPPRPTKAAVDPDAAAAAARLEAEAREHPCQACPDRETHERWAARADRLAEQVEGLDRRIRTRTETLARRFDRVLAVLQTLGYVDGSAILPKGEMLSRIYGEADLLVAEAIGDGVLDDLPPAEAAAVVSTLVHESRERVPRPVEMPTARTRAAVDRLAAAYRRIRDAEDANHVELCRDIDLGFAPTIFGWAEGKPLDDVLSTTELAPGDFVRNCKQLLDLLRQIAEVAPPRPAAAASGARDAVNRGVIAYTGLGPGDHR